MAEDERYSAVEACTLVDLVDFTDGTRSTGETVGFIEALLEATEPDDLPRVLAHLAQNTSPAVRAVAASENRTGGYVLTSLSWDTDEGVRRGAAGNASTPRGVLVALSFHVDPSTSHAARATIDGLPT